MVVDVEEATQKRCRPHGRLPCECGEEVEGALKQSLNSITCVNEELVVLDGDDWWCAVIYLRDHAR